ncbi:hypothetical protein ACM5Q9_11825 [Advenella sp. RU8]|uniref:hypothetical protein n=1 Tax=Advenella sp. RU8 TaxID=3399575 RepID=UPI003AACA9FA
MIDLDGHYYHGRHTGDRLSLPNHACKRKAISALIAAFPFSNLDKVTRLMPNLGCFYQTKEGSRWLHLKEMNKLGMTELKIFRFPRHKNN